MAITFVAASANVAAASGNLTVTPPATQTNDIMICAVTSHDNVACTFPTGWTIYQEGNNTTAMRATLAWKRCVGAEAAFTITHTAGDGIVANVGVYRGSLATGSPINASVLTHNASSSTCTAATITTTVDGCMFVFTMHDSDNGSSSAQSSANLGAMTERFDNASNLGLDQAVSGADVLQTTAGATGASTGTLSLGPDINSGANTALAPLAITAYTITKPSDVDYLKATTATKLSDVDYKKALTLTKLSDVDFLRATTATKLSDVRYLKQTTVSKLSDVDFKKSSLLTKLSDVAYKLITTLTKLSDVTYAAGAGSQTITKTSDVDYKGITTKTKNSDVDYLKPATLTKLSDVDYLKAFTLTKTSNVDYLAPSTKTKLSNVTYKGPKTITKTSDVWYWDGMHPPGVTEVLGQVWWYS